MTELKAQFEAALLEHARKTGGLMVGDIVRVNDDLTVRIASCDEGGRLTFEREDS